MDKTTIHRRYNDPLLGEYRRCCCRCRRCRLLSPNPHVLWARAPKLEHFGSFALSGALYSNIIKIFTHIYPSIHILYAYRVETECEVLELDFSIRWVTAFFPFNFSSGECASCYCCWLFSLCVCLSLLRIDITRIRSGDKNSFFRFELFVRYVCVCVCKVHGKRITEFDLLLWLSLWTVLCVWRTNRDNTNKITLNVFSCWCLWLRLMSISSESTVNWWYTGVYDSSQQQANERTRKKASNRSEIDYMTLGFDKCKDLWGSILVRRKRWTMISSLISVDWKRWHCQLID